jgi:hypothetical protein
MRRIAVLAALLIACLGGCGKKADPRAPELVAPQVINNLTARPTGDGVVLTWSRPTEYVDGRPIKDLGSFLIFRKEISPSCPDCLVPYRQLTSIFVEDREKFVKQKQYRFVDEEAQPKAVYRYRVVSELNDGTLSEPSNEVEATRGP